MRDYEYRGYHIIMEDGGCYCDQCDSGSEAVASINTLDNVDTLATLCDECLAEIDVVIDFLEEE